MKKATLFKSFAGLFAALSFSVAVRAEAIEITAVEVLRAGDRAEVTFRLDAARRAVKAGEAMALQPVITDGTHSVSLPAILVRGRRAEHLDERYAWVTGQPIEEAIVVRPGTSTTYAASVEFQAWMDGVELTLESLTWGCCTETAAPTQTLAAGILPVEPQFIEIVEYPETPDDTPKTMGDMLARTFPFVIPESDYVEGEPIYDDDRENALIVYFRQNVDDIEPDYASNRLTLANMTAAVQAITTSPDSRVTRIVVAGFASPEGAYTYNDRLAWERGMAIKEYLARSTDTPESDIVLHNGSEDWRGLRMLVEESDLPEKEQILRVIADYPALGPDGRSKPRLEALRGINGGRTYRTLYDSYFPRLRNGAFIRVYYTNVE